MRTVKEIDESKKLSMTVAQGDLDIATEGLKEALEQSFNFAKLAMEIDELGLQKPADDILSKPNDLEAWINDAVTKAKALQKSPKWFSLDANEQSNVETVISCESRMVAAKKALQTQMGVLNQVEAEADKEMEALEKHMEKMALLGKESTETSTE